MTFDLTGRMAPLIVVMGVSGCGKSTVGAALAQRLGVHFIDGDDLHPAANVAKMTAGIPLEDADRWPWLGDIGRTLSDHSGSGLVIACSALKRTYRDVIRWEAPAAVFVHAHGEGELIHSRMAARLGHYMPAALLQSQLSILEPLAEDENGLVLDIRLPVDTLVESVLLSLTTEGSTWAAAVGSGAPFVDAASVVHEEHRPSQSKLIFPRPTLRRSAPPSSPMETK